MASQEPASDPEKTAASPGPAPPVPDGGHGPAGGRGRVGGRGRLRAAVETLGEAAELLAASTPGLTIFTVLVVKALIALAGGAEAGWLRVLDAAGSIALVAALGYLLVRLLTLLQQRFLWRVRRKLVLSYVLIGFVPIALFGVSVVVFGALLLYTASSSLVQRSFADVMEDADELAAMSAIDLRGRAAPAEMRVVLSRRLEAVRERYPGASIAVAGKQAGRARVAAAGPWRHASGDPGLPDWLDDDPDPGGFVLTRGRSGWLVVARGVRRFEEDGLTYAVVADLPVAGDVILRMQASSGVTLTDFNVIEAADEADAGPAGAGRVAAASFDGGRVSFGAPPLDVASALETPLWAHVDLLDWSSGRRGRGRVGFRVPFAVFSRQLAQEVDGTLVTSFLLVLGLLGTMFLIIEGAALVLCFALARSITGAVHELFTGTERVQAGDLAHRIRVDTEDQLGELAESFNAMTGSISDLLTQAEEKRRLEEELRIARDIQMSLLPEGPASVPGLAVAAACRPAREVGGDYFDFIRLDEHRLGVLVADVSGKGTSAAFYMAELKGVVLSLSRFHQSPRELLIEVNRILSAALDGRTFITMTYAVVDLAARRLTYARAGHTPLIHVPSAADGSRTTRVLAPDGLIVGLQIDGVEEKFAELLEESAFPIEAGDLVALFTDGVTEAMNEASDLFGEERLSRTLTERIDLAPDDLKQRILGDVEAFAGAAEQHDDMTIVLLRVGDAPFLPPAGRP